jgi:hypothetical protein
MQRWAGPDQAQALSLCQWLYHRVAALSPFLQEQEQGQGDSPGDGHQPPTAAVLRALAAAADALRGREFALRHGAWVAAHEGQLDEAVVRYWRGAQQVGRGGAGGGRPRPA